VAQPPQKSGASRGSGQPLREFEGTKEKIANERLEEVCGDLEEELEEIKVKYEMYFLGIERMEPSRRRDELKRNIARLKNAFTRNAGLRFRIQALHARYLAYERLWMRSAREKENGTYRRDLLKARRRRREETKGEGPRRSSLEAEDVDLSDFGPEDEEEPEPAAPAAVEPTPTAEEKEPPASRPPGALSEKQMRALYDAYVEAKKRCHEDVSKLTLQAVAQSVNKQIPEIVSRYNAREVEFKVVIRDGRAVLKAVPRS